MKRTRKNIRRIWINFLSYIGWEDYIATALIVLGFLGYFQGPIPFIPQVTDFYLDIRSELIGIGITVLIIDNVNEMYRRRAEKERLILQMGSTDNGFALEAVRQLSVKGWLYDGSLRKAHLSKANLSGAILGFEMQDFYSASPALALLRRADLSETVLLDANFSKANLGNVIFARADLENSNLSNTNLMYAILTGANLRGADLRWATLLGADLEEADLSGADLSGITLRENKLSKADLTGATITNQQIAYGAISLEGTKMPDGNIYDPTIHTEIARLRRELWWTQKVGQKNGLA